MESIPSDCSAVFPSIYGSPACKLVSFRGRCAEDHIGSKSLEECPFDLRLVFPKHKEKEEEGPGFLALIAALLIGALV